MNKLTLTLSFLVLAIAAGLQAQDNPAVRAAREWRSQHERQILDEFVELLKLPNITRDVDALRRNADHIAGMLRARGIEARLVGAEGAAPLVLGTLPTPGATRTIVFYAHYDGQALNPSEWTTPPFAPTLRSRAIDAGGEIIPLPASGQPLDPEARLYARSTSDDKAPIVSMLTALDALRAAKIPLRSNIKFVFEGEEEAGSPNLERVLAANRDLFAGDVWLMCDGPVHQTRRPLIYFGARDVVTFDLTVFGPKNELHSGHYGNWAPNPALALARLLASMKDANDRVVVKGFYDEVEPLGALERQALADAPDIDRQLMGDLWLGRVDGFPRKLVELITEPSLNIRGLTSAHTGAQATNVIPASATASMDIRLVKGMDAEHTLDRVLDHIRAQGFFVVEQPPTEEIRRAHPAVVQLTRGRVGLGSARMPMNLPIAQEIIRAVESVRGPAVKLPTMGGSLPLAEIEKPLGTRTIVLPMANHDNRQHSSDENLRIQNLWDGIELMAALLML